MMTGSAVTIGTLAGEVGYPLRLPPELKAQLEAWARRERRSLNAHIVFLLESAVRSANPSLHVEGSTASKDDE